MRQTNWPKLICPFLLGGLLLCVVTAPLGAEPPESSRRMKSVLLRPAEPPRRPRVTLVAKQNVEEAAPPAGTGAVQEPSGDRELLPPGMLQDLPAAPGNLPELVEGIDVAVQPIGSIDIAARRPLASNELPPNLAANAFTDEVIDGHAGFGGWAPYGVASLSGEFCYRPLYFEEANYERYGNRRGCIQPVWSAARFYATIPALPYLMANAPPDECRYKRYPYQAGRSAPRVRELPPLSVRGAVVETGVVMGLILLIP